MTAARLSPAASLLRNSKLFALPPAVALPASEPSSEPVPRSDSATTIYPTRAAIETPLTSLSKGDWGFKRSLPLKSTTRSGNPSVRLNRGIDTAEHIADFDSAADHVLTLKKFQELNQSIQHPKLRPDHSKEHLGVFRNGWDNTTNLSESAPSYVKYSGTWPSIRPSDLQKQMPIDLQAERPASDEHITDVRSPKLPRSLSTEKPRRWRYDGPSLVQMSGLEFDRWIKSIDATKKRAFKEALKGDLLIRKKNTYAAKAQDEGTVGEVDLATLEITEEEITEHLKTLRQQPQIFGPLIAKFLDLPDGPLGERVRVGSISDVWQYGRTTNASDSYSENGPPRTHPSAGLSYIHTNRWVQNHAAFGPQDEKLPVVARQVKIRARGPMNIATLGVAGFIAEREPYRGTRDPYNAPYEPQAGGQKTVVTPSRAEIDEKGALKLSVSTTGGYQIEKERAVHNSMIVDDRVAAVRPGKGSGPRVMQPLIRSGRPAPTYKKRDDLAFKSSDEDLDFLGKI